MKIAFILGKTPLQGRFFWDGTAGIALVLLFASWMMPLHLPPWLGWHSEILAFASALLFAGALVKQHFKLGRTPILLPATGWPLAMLSLVVAIQATTGQIRFKGDALVLIFYLFLCLLAMAAGYATAAAKEPRTTSATPLVDYLALLLVMGGAMSVVVAFVQSLDIWESANYIARMHDLRRPGGNIGQPNQLATLILFSIASVIYLFETRRMRAVSALPIVAVLIVGLAMTESRGGVLGLLVMTAWWALKRRRIGSALSKRVAGLGLVFFAACFVLWPTILSVIHEGGWSQATQAHVNTRAGTRLVVWPQLWQAALIKPWFGWGLREVSTAHNAVADIYDASEPFAYAHNIVLDLAVGVGLPLTLLLVVTTAVWLWRRAQAANDLLTWYCLAIALPFGVHCMLEYPFAYAYMLLPVLLLLGVLEARLAAAKMVRIPWWPAAAALAFASAAMAWTVVEYISIEEDFRVARFEAMRMGATPGDYVRPKIALLTQLDALLQGARIAPAPGMQPDRIDLARAVALRYPWPATLNRYALSLALNGNAEEALRQLKVIHILYGERQYAQIKANWEALTKEKYPQLGHLTLP